MEEDEESENVLFLLSRGFFILLMYTFDDRFRALPMHRDATPICLAPSHAETLRTLLGFIWPTHAVTTLEAQTLELLTAARARCAALPEEAVTTAPRWSERQLVLICYGDHLRSRDPHKTPLQALHEFCRRAFGEPAFANLIIHLLPIYTSPYKDGGFDIADPFAVNSNMGTWADVQGLAQDFQFALDFVANHLSSASPWFARYLADDPRYRDFFIGFDDEADVRYFERVYLPAIYRPRPHPPLIPVTRADGRTRWVYMTFSDHQPDVNYQNPFVFLKMAEVLLFYVLQGASMIRLDAIPYLWKEWGTSCAHHPKTHALVQLFRLVCEIVQPGVKLLAESMEPLADSQRYLSTADAAKAHLAYNFVPCGLIPHTLLTADATLWQRHLPDFSAPGADVNWAVVCGVTHDGSSINPCRAPQSEPGAAILQEAEINAIARFYNGHGAQEIQQRGALPADHPAHLQPDYPEAFSARHQAPPRFVNYKTVCHADGQPQPIVYEAISTYASLFDEQPEKILAALGMALALPGIPFIYLTSLFGKLNDYAYYYETGNPRELNRGRVLLEDVLRELDDPATLACQVCARIVPFLRQRVTSPAFHPASRVIPLTPPNKAIIAFLREAPAGDQTALIVQNVSAAPERVTLTLPSAFSSGVDMLTQEQIVGDRHGVAVTLPPFALRWFALR